MAKNRPSIDRWEWRTAVAAVPASAFLIHVGAANTVELVKATAAVYLGLALLAMLGIGLARRGETGLPDTAFTVALLGFGLALVISTVAAEDTVRSLAGVYMRWNGALPYLAYAMLALVVARAAGTPRRRVRLTQILLWSAVVLALYALMQRAGVDPVPWDLIYEHAAPSALGNPNFASAYFGIAVPIAVMTLVRGSSSAAIRSVASGAIVVLFAGQYATGSFLGPFAALAGVAVGASLLLAGSESRRRRRIGTIGLLGGSAAAVALGVVWLADLVPSPYAVAIRFYYWKAGFRMWLDDPLLGVGLGRYQDFFRRFRPEEGFARFGTGAIADGPHGVPMTFLAEGGLLLFLPYVAVLAAVAYCAVTGVRRAGGRNERLLAAGISGAWGGYLAQSIGNYGVPQLEMVGWTLAGLVVAAAASVAPRKVLRPWRVPVGAAIVVIAVVGASVAWRPLRADLLAREVQVLESRGRIPAAIDVALESAELAPWESRYRFAAGRLTYIAGDREEAYDRLSDTASRFPDEWGPVIASAEVATELGRVEDAIFWYGLARRIDPYAAEAAFEHGRLLLAADRADEAVPALEEAVRVGEDSPDWWRVLADAYEAAGHPDEAAAADARAAAMEGG